MSNHTITRPEDQTHLIPCTARAVNRNQFRALCGALVDGSSHARDGKPTCDDCAAIDEEDERQLALLRSEAR